MISLLTHRNKLRLMQFVAAVIIWPTQLIAAPTSWPLLLESDQAQIQLFQPQIESLENDRVEARAAVAIVSSVSSQPHTEPVFAAIRFTGSSQTDPSATTVSMTNIELIGLHFGEGVDTPNDLIHDLKLQFHNLSLNIDKPRWTNPNSASDVEVSGYDTGVISNPINILFRTEASVLVSLNGEPVLEMITDSKYSWVSNANFPMLGDANTYYLFIDQDLWFQSSSIFGPWTRTSNLPDNVSKLLNHPDSLAANPSLGTPGNANIIVSRMPTELLVSDGLPAWAPLAGLRLLYMTNTDDDVFLDLQSGRHYTLLRGRWFSGSLQHNGSTWQPVPNDDLPAAFADIDVQSSKSHVLAHVHGTPQAQTALLENSLPRVKTVLRDDTSFQAEWDGEPQFEPVTQSSGLAYAINTPDSIFQVGGLFYACEDGVWYESDSAFGPWWIATEVPDIIYDLPVSNPQHRVTYTRIYDVTPEHVYFGYTPGYLNNYSYRGSVVYGSGWRYQSWFGNRYYSSTWNRGFQSYSDPWYAWGYFSPIYRPHYYNHYRRHNNSHWDRQNRHQRRDGRRNHYSNDRSRGQRNSDGNRQNPDRGRVADNRNKRRESTNNSQSVDRSNVSYRNPVSRGTSRADADARPHRSSTANRIVQSGRNNQVSNSNPSRPRQNARSERPRTVNSQGQDRQKRKERLVTAINTTTRPAARSASRTTTRPQARPASRITTRSEARPANNPSIRTNRRQQNAVLPTRNPVRSNQAVKPVKSVKPVISARAEDSRPTQSSSNTKASKVSRPNVARKPAANKRNRSKHREQ